MCRHCQTELPLELSEFRLFDIGSLWSDNEFEVFLKVFLKLGISDLVKLQGIAVKLYRSCVNVLWGDVLIATSLPWYACELTDEAIQWECELFLCLQWFISSRALWMLRLLRSEFCSRLCPQCVLRIDQSSLHQLSQFINNYCWYLYVHRVIFNL